MTGVDGKELTVVIPRFSEGEEEVAPLLASIAGQLGHGWDATEVVVVTDGGEGHAEPLSARFLSRWPMLEVRQVLRGANGGPGLARQSGIDAARGEWLMFCDADDCLQNVGALEYLLQEARASRADVVTSAWLEELPDGAGGWRYLTHAHEATWMHGKLFRASFLAERGVRHHPDLRVHEDTYFLSVATALGSVRELDGVTYVWRWGDDTITRRDGSAYTWDSMPTFVLACTESFRRVADEAPSVMPEKAAQLALYTFFTLHSRAWLDKPGKVAPVEAEFRRDMAPWWDAVDEFEGSGGFPALYARERAKSLDVPETTTWADWSARMRRR